MGCLSVQDYDEAERRALLSMPNRIVECCQPTTFLHESYPVRIHGTKAAMRYVDVMQDGRSEGTFSALLGGITGDELTTMRSVAARVAAATESLYGRRLVPRSGLLRALNVVRHIRYLFPRSATVLEIGAGSGYVGALLLEMGYRYVATDITQAFYIWQNHLLNAMAPDRALELATEERGFFGSLEDVPRAIHVPWWKFVVPRPDVRIRVDVVTCNHALCEMHPNALAYALAISRHLLEGTGPKTLLFEGWGSTVRAPIWHAGRALSRAGFVFAHNDVRASAAVRGDGVSAEGAMRLPLQGADSDEGRYHPHIHISELNSVGRTFLKGRLETEAAARHPLQEFDEMLRSVLGGADLATDDERFMTFVADERR